MQKKVASCVHVLIYCALRVILRLLPSPSTTTAMRRASSTASLHGGGKLRSIFRQRICSLFIFPFPGRSQYRSTFSSLCYFLLQQRKKKEKEEEPDWALNGADRSRVVSISVFVAVLCLCIVIGHLIQESRWVKESFAALLISTVVAKPQILTCSDLPELADTYNRLSHLVVTLSQPMYDTLVSTLVISGGHGHSLYIGARGHGVGHGVGRGRFQCTFCGKLGHLEECCWDKHPHLCSIGPSGCGGGRIAAGNGPSSS
ncbi:Sodium/hydrogen exchanger 4 [Nymphaea thermarum]|nr:Sodium/hydrogen exchanger 4 [Nymphaea thermarum]